MMQNGISWLLAVLARFLDGLVMYELIVLGDKYNLHAF